jgi:hypothetical protein
MKKVLFLGAILMLMAAACNSGNQAANQTNPMESHSQASVDAAIQDLNASVDSEESTNTQSDDDVINSDQSVMTGFEGAVNENSY